MVTVTTLAARMAALANQLEADADHSTSGNGLAHAADLIRAELAAAGPQTVWAVHGTVYEDEGVYATLATPELAEQHRAELAKHQKFTDFDVRPYDVLDKLPMYLKVESRSAHVSDNGTVRMTRTSQSEEWDHRTSDKVTLCRRDDSTDIDVSDADGNAETVLLEQVNAVLAGYAEEFGWTAERLAAAQSAVVNPEPPAWVGQRCYEASFGWVHVRSSCRCPR